MLMYSGVRVSQTLHRNMTFRILHSKIDDFIEKVPTGRIINRFSKDIDIVDRIVPWNLSYFVRLFCAVLSELALVVITITPFLAIVVVPLIIIAFFMQAYYMKIKREIVRGEAVSRSPIINLVGDTVRGLPSVRGMKLQKYLKDKMRFLINENLKNSILTYALDSWFGIRISFLNLFLIQVPCYALIVYFLKYSDKIEVSPYQIAYAMFAITSA